MTKCHCGKRAIYNIRGVTNGIFCNEHKEPNMINVNSPKCVYTNCEKYALFNNKGNNNGIFCNEHKEPNMINVKKSECRVDGCTTRPNYNIKGQNKGIYCNKHKEPHMIDVKSKICAANNCTTRPNYNTIGKSNGLFCFIHKEQNMVDVTHKTCKIVGCKIRPIFNINGLKAQYCNIHKEPNMVNVKDKLCIIDGCEKQPLFNIKGLNAIFCGNHKEPNMINVKIKLCEFNGCTIVPTYNNNDETIRKFCAIHKESTMIYIRNHTCSIDNCTSIKKVGLLGKKSSHCAKHKQKGMIKSPNKKCSLCKQLGTYEHNKTRFCEEHTPDNAQNLGIYPCTSCGLDDILTNGTCSTCDPVTQQVIQHAKENRIKDVLTAAKITFVHDKMLETTQCGRERPDFQIDCGTHMVYIEVDEHQHQSYACECEQTRMINLIHVRGMPTLFIRYNPDTYTPIKGQRQVTATQREKKLVDYIKYAIQHPPKDAFANVLYLFYDTYNIQLQEWEILIAI